MFKRLFVDHPKSVDESYVEHFGVASKFGVTMIWGGLCALVHAIVPGWCITTGSDTIHRGCGGASFSDGAARRLQAVSRRCACRG